MAKPDPMSPEDQPYTTIEVASLLGLAVRSVQLMVDRGELDAWKTPGGHRRISRASVERWLAERRGGGRSGDVVPSRSARRAPRVLLIEDSVHFQNLVRLLVGPNHRIVLPGSAILGAGLILWADLLSRLAVAPAELPIGIVTASLGGPFFLGLLLRERQKWGS